MTTTPEKPSLAIVKHTIQAPIQSIRVNIPTGSRPEKVMSFMHECCAGLSKVEEAEEHLKFTLGHVLNFINTNKLYRPEHRSFERFMKTEILGRYPRLSRSTLREGMQVTAAYPNLTDQDIKKVGATKLMIAARKVNEEGLAPRQAGQILTKIARMPVQQAQEAFSKKAVSGRPAVLISIRVTAAVSRKWRKLTAGRKPADVFSELVNAASPRDGGEVAAA